MAEVRGRALVVDDEATSRMLVTEALTREGFACHTVWDGLQASVLIERGECYDMVVTDLAMPYKHGHALATELLTLKNRPLIVVLTALNDPRLTKDLLTRGVDEIMWKPIAYDSFAAKLSVLVNRRQQQAHESAVAVEADAEIEDPAIV